MFSYRAPSDQCFPQQGDLRVLKARGALCSRTAVMHSAHSWRNQNLDLSPSQKDGISKVQEECWRRRYCRLVEASARNIAVGFNPIQTAIIYLHQYYAVRSMARNDPLIMVSAALLLACKVEEQSKTVMKVVTAVFQTALKGRTTALSIIAKPEISKQIKDNVEVAERALLYSLGFNLEVLHPPQLAVDYLRTAYNVFVPEGKQVSVAEWDKQLRSESGEAYEVIFQLQRITWSLGLLSYQIPYYLHYQPLHIACACLYMAAQSMRLQPALRNGWHWWEEEPFHIPIDTLQEIVGSLLDLQSLAENSAAASPTPPASSPVQEETAHQTPGVVNTPGTQPRSDSVQSPAQFSPG